MWTSIVILLFAFHATLAQNVEPFAFENIEAFINETFVNITNELGDLALGNLNVTTKGQEFGSFELYFYDCIAIGLDSMYAEIIEIGFPVQIKNITVYLPEAVLECEDYFLNGSLIFPFGNKILPLSGSDGKFSIGIQEMRVSLHMLLGSIGDEQDPIILAEAHDMSFFAVNLMGGDKLGWSFNTVLDDAAIVAFDYYKDALIGYVKKPVKDLINSIFCSKLPIFC